MLTRILEIAISLTVIVVIASGYAAWGLTVLAWQGVTRLLARGG